MREEPARYRGILTSGIGVTGLVLFVLYRFVVMTGIFATNYHADPTADRANAEKIILSDPVRGEMFAAIKVKFPKDFEAIRDRVVATARSNRTADEARGIAARMAGDLVHSHAMELAYAPANALISYRVAAGNIAQSMGGISTDDCAYLMTHGLFVASPDPDERLKVMDAPLTEYRLAILNALPDSPAAKSAPSPVTLRSKAKLHLRDLMLSQQISDASFEAFAANGTHSTSIPYDQCRLGMVYFWALSVLPEDEADNASRYFAGKVT